jgi:hypothetical protein
MDDASSSLLRSPRSNLRAALCQRAALPEGLALGLVDASVGDLVPADAENKLRHKKLYLVLDLDETLVYSQRMEPGATPKGTQIFVRGQPFDCVPRPGLTYFLRNVHQHYVVFLYTMGDQEYTEAVLRVIDPAGQYFRGARARPSAARLSHHLRLAARRQLAPPSAPTPRSSPRFSLQVACAAGVRASRGRSRAWRARCASGA